MAGGWSHRGGCVCKLKSTEVENWSPPTDPSTTLSTVHAAVVRTQTNTKQTHPRLCVPGALSVRAGMAAWPDWTVGMRLLIIHQHADSKSTHPLKCSKIGFWFNSPFLSGFAFPLLGDGPITRSYPPSIFLLPPTLSDLGTNTKLPSNNPK